MSYRTVILATVIASVMPWSGCAERDERELKLESTFESLIAALDGGDAGALWNLCDEPTQMYFAKLAGEIKEVMALVDRHYPTEGRDAARLALGGGALGHAKTGRDLFVAMVDPSRMAAPGDRDSREVDKVVVGAYTATVMTKAGRSLEFTVGSDGSFRTGGFMKAFLKQPALVTLTDNLATARKNCAEYARGSGQGSSGGDG